MLIKFLLFCVAYVSANTRLDTLADIIIKEQKSNLARDDPIFVLPNKAYKLGSYSFYFTLEHWNGRSDINQSIADKAVCRYNLSEVTSPNFVLNDTMESPEAVWWECKRGAHCDIPNIACDLHMSTGLRLVIFGSGVAILLAVLVTLGRKLKSFIDEKVEAKKQEEDRQKKYESETRYTDISTAPNPPQP